MKYLQVRAIILALFLRFFKFPQTYFLINQNVKKEKTIKNIFYLHFKINFISSGLRRGGVWYVGGLHDHRLDCVTHMSEHGHYSPESGEETHHKGFITHGE